MNACLRASLPYLLAVVLCYSCGCTQLIARRVLPQDGVRPKECSVRVDRGVRVTARDGVALIADIYHPVVERKTPTILVRIPFSNTFKNRIAADIVGEFWASRGYTVVLQGTRGRYKSGGQFYPLLHERDDGIDTLQWLARQPWYDGRLGMWGGSAFGQTQWVLADQTEPGPSALIIQIASSDFRSMFHPGGAFSLESALFWAMRSRGPIDETPSVSAMLPGFDGFPLIDADRRAGGDVGFFKDWVLHDERDSYWETIDSVDRVRDTKAPTLVFAGWYDPFLPTQLRDFMTLRKYGETRVAAESRLIVGPWVHADAVRFPDGTTIGDYRSASLAPSLPWFDRHLLGNSKTDALYSPVRIYVMGENVWRNEDEWPLARTQFTALYLHSAGHANSSRGDGRLGELSPSTDEPDDSYVYDPRDPVPSEGGAMLGPRAGIKLQNGVEARPDVLVYSTEQLKSDVEVTGPVSALLFVETTAPSTDFAIKLVDVHANGQAYNVSDGILRRAYSATGAPQRIAIELWPTSMLFQKGHRIRVEITSSNYPRYDRNPNTGRNIPKEMSPIIATQTIHHGVETPSQIILPIIPR